MDDALDRLRSASLVDWADAASALRAGLAKAAPNAPLGDDDLFMLLRPYLWYVHDVSFQDLADICSDALKALDARRDALLGTEIERDFLALGLFLSAYLEEGNLDASGFPVLVGSAEIAAAVSASALAVRLDRGDPAAATSLRRLASILQALEGAKHSAYWCIRAIGDRFVEQLDLIHTLHPADQGFLLHALDGFAGNDDVARFYDDFIRVTPDAVLRQEAEHFRERVRG